MNYTAKFPSGKECSLSGIFNVIRVKRILAPIVNSQSGMMVLDPRCIVTDENGKLVYNPRDFMFLFDKEMFEWMKENPSWGTK